MAKGFVKKFFPLLAVLLLAPWPAAYAQSYGGEITGQGVIQIEVADDSVAPSAIAFRGTIGGVNPGDLFYIDVKDYPPGIFVSLHFTNTDELSHCYRYLILEVGIYVQNGGNEWERASGWDGAPVPDMYITMQNGSVSFSLPGRARYRVSIDGGCFYCIATSVEGGSVSPRFYLTVD